MHLIKFLDDPLSPTPTELGFAFASSFDEALDKAAATVGPLRTMHGARVGYRIEDVKGRIIWIGPGTHDDA